MKLIFHNKWILSFMKLPESNQYLHQMKTCDREGLPAPAMAALLSIVSGGDDEFLAAFVVGGNAETNTEKQ